MRDLLLARLGTFATLETSFSLVKNARLLRPVAGSTPISGPDVRGDASLKVEHVEEALFVGEVLGEPCLLGAEMRDPLFGGEMGDPLFAEEMVALLLRGEMWEPLLEDGEWGPI